MCWTRCRTTCRATRHHPVLFGIRLDSPRLLVYCVPDGRPDRLNIRIGNAFLPRRSLAVEFASIGPTCNRGGKRAHLSGVEMGIQESGGALRARSHRPRVAAGRALLWTACRSHRCRKLQKVARACLRATPPGRELRASLTRRKRRASHPLCVCCLCGGGCGLCREFLPQNERTK
jgi:hypothetical protein